jgi:hypothetical protein
MGCGASGVEPVRRARVAVEIFFRCLALAVPAVAFAVWPLRVYDISNRQTAVAN